MATRRRSAKEALLRALPTSEQRVVGEVLRDETVGGVLLLAAAAVALVWASSPWSGGYETMRDTVVGPESLGLDLTLRTWAADGLLAIFFFVAGLELKRELVVGQLRRPAEAVLPMVAALAGMVVPALLYLAVTVTSPGAAKGWAVPMATDIAFALAVLAVVASALPTPLRAFLLTLAIVDDLGAILVIALVFTESINLPAVVVAVGLIAAYAGLQHLRLTRWWVTVPLALALWVAVHESGIHATVAGVALGLLTRVRPDRGEALSPAERLEHLVRPISAGVAVPAFALFAAGVRIDGETLRNAATDPVAVGVVVGLVAGKFIGVFGGSWLTARLTRAELSPELRWADVAAVALLSGIGFTVSLLIGELSFPRGDREQYVTLGVLAGSLLAAILATLVLRRRARWHGRKRARSRTPD